MINLFTSIYTDKSLVRQKELIYCLNKNIDNHHINKTDFSAYLDNNKFDYLNRSVLVKALCALTG